MRNASSVGTGTVLPGTEHVKEKKQRVRRAQKHASGVTTGNTVRPPNTVTSTDAIPAAKGVTSNDTLRSAKGVASADTPGSCVHTADTNQAANGVTIGNTLEVTHTIIEVTRPAPADGRSGIVWDIGVDDGDEVRLLLTLEAGQPYMLAVDGIAADAREGEGWAGHHRSTLTITAALAERPRLGLVRKWRSDEPSGAELLILNLADPRTVEIHVDGELRPLKAALSATFQRCASDASIALTSRTPDW